MGFEDIEDTSKKERPLKAWHSFRFCYVNGLTEKKEYHQSAGALFWTYKFINRDQKEIWRLHSMGVSVREIELRVKNYKKSMINYIIQKIAKEIK